MMVKVCGELSQKMAELFRLVNWHNLPRWWKSPWNHEIDGKVHYNFLYIAIFHSHVLLTRGYPRWFKHVQIAKSKKHQIEWHSEGPWEGGGDWNMWMIFPYIGNVIIPIDELICFRGVGQPPTSNLSGPPAAMERWVQSFSWRSEAYDEKWAENEANSQGQICKISKIGGPPDHPLFWCSILNNPAIGVIRLSQFMETFIWKKHEKKGAFHLGMVISKDPWETAA